MAPDPDDAEVRLAESFGDVARALLQTHGLQATLLRIVELAVDSLEPCEYAGISYVEGRTITSPASTHELPRIVDEIQAEVGEGPCLDAIREHGVFQSGDLATEVRWPRFARRANQETGIVSVLGVRLFVGENTMGALNLYSTRRHAFDDTDIALAFVFAVHAAVAMNAARQAEGLERAVDTRDIIGQAKGILMSREGISDDEAFDVLRRASQRLNVRLAQVAQGIVHPKDGDAD